MKLKTMSLLVATLGLGVSLSANAMTHNVQANTSHAASKTSVQQSAHDALANPKLRAQVEKTGRQAESDGMASVEAANGYKQKAVDHVEHAKKAVSDHKQ